jgi:ubiquinone/menaquinone biosynthesis C-methylase UbiE
MAAHYDDPNFSYVNYWQSRDYENLSEIEAINSLLKKQIFPQAADIGGGFGRLIPTILNFSKKVLLIEPSAKQRQIAKKSFTGIKTISVLPGTAEKTRLRDKSVSLITVIRVMHHLPDPLPAFNEFFRILKPDGILILEFANSKHFKAQILSLLTGKPILPIPIEKRSPSNIKKRTIEFVNHHPITIQKLLKRAGFEIDKTLSVSNFRSPTLKKILPIDLLVNLEKKVQSPLSGLYFGPSIFILARKPRANLDKNKNP